MHLPRSSSLNRWLPILLLSVPAWCLDPTYSRIDLKDPAQGSWLISLDLDSSPQGEVSLWSQVPGKSSAPLELAVLKSATDDYEMVSGTPVFLKIAPTQDQQRQPILNVTLSFAYRKKDSQGFGPPCAHLTIQAPVKNGSAGTVDIKAYGSIPSQSAEAGGLTLNVKAYGGAPLGMLQPFLVLKAPK